MANNCYATIKFTGSEAQLNEIEKNIITKDRFDKDSLSFDLVEKLLPGVKDKDLFALVGCDYNKLILNRYSESEIAQWHAKVEKFVADNHWIGFRDDYINNVWSLESKKDSHSLTLELELPWYCPYNFFFFVAEKFNVQVSLLEKIEGNYTKIIFEKDDEISVVTNNFESSLNVDFVQQAINLDYLKPAEFLLAAIHNNNDSFINELLNHYKISQDDIIKAVENIKALSEYDSNQESIFAEIAEDSDDFKNIIDSLSKKAIEITEQKNINPVDNITNKRFKF